MEDASRDYQGVDFWDQDWRGLLGPGLACSALCFCNLAAGDHPHPHPDRVMAGVRAAPGSGDKRWGWMLRRRQVRARISWANWWARHMDSGPTRRTSGRPRLTEAISQ